MNDQCLNFFKDVNTDAQRSHLCNLPIELVAGKHDGSHILTPSSALTLSNSICLFRNRRHKADFKAPAQSLLTITNLKVTKVKR